MKTMFIKVKILLKKWCEKYPEQALIAPFGQERRGPLEALLLLAQRHGRAKHPRSALQGTRQTACQARICEERAKKVCCFA
jgi:hypothetical protein